MIDVDFFLSNNVNDTDDTDDTDNDINIDSFTCNPIWFNLLDTVNEIQQDDLVCNNTQYYLNNNSANSIQAIVATIIEVKMNGMFYIPAK